MSDNTPSTPKKGIQVIARAATILRSLENEPNGLSLGKIALRVGLSRSTVQRIVDALSEEHLLIGASPSSGVKLGPAILRMAQNSSFNFVEFLRPYIVELSQEIGETVDVSERQKTNTVFVDEILGSARLVIVSTIGEAMPLHCLASGKAMLSMMTDKEVLKLLGSKTYKNHTDNTIVQPDKLMAELIQIRETNISFDNEEHIEGVCALGTSIQEPGGQLYAISIPIPTVRFHKKKQQMVEALLKCRANILRDIGV